MTQEMLDACLTVYDSVDAVIKAAAVADYRPHEKAAQKIKKNEESLTIDLDKNPDILKLLGEKKDPSVPRRLCRGNAEPYCQRGRQSAEKAP